MNKSRNQIRQRKSTEFREVVPVPVLGLFCFYVVAWFLQVGIRVEWLGAMRFELILGSLLTVIAVGLLASKPVRAGREGGRVAVSALLLLLLISIWVPLSIDPVVSWPIYVERVVKFAFMAIFIVAFVRSVRDLRWFVFSFLLACAYICQESFRGALSGAMIWENQGVPRLHGDTPMFEHPNSLGGLAIGVLPFAYYLFVATPNRVSRLALVALAAIATAVVMYSGSRTAYVGVIVLLAYILLSANIRLGKAVVIGLMILGAAWVAMPDSYRARFGTIATGQEIQGNSMGARRQIIEDAVDIFVEYPFGVGVAAFPVKRLEMFGRKPDTHNLYLQVATNLGMQGLLAFLAFVYVLWSSLSTVVRRIKAKRDLLGEFLDGDSVTPPAVDGALSAANLRFLMAIAQATQAYLLVRLVLGLFGHDLYEIYWWIVTGLVIALAGITQKLQLTETNLRFSGDRGVAAQDGRTMRFRSSRGRHV